MIFPREIGYELMKCIQEANKYAQHGIRINAICPGYVDTPLLKAATASGHMDAEILSTPMRRIGKVEEIVDCMIFLASSMSSFMSGATLVVDGFVPLISFLEGHILIICQGLHFKMSDVYAQLAIVSIQSISGFCRRNLLMCVLALIS